jgi:HAD superfamily hydrolase (TIGR01509 family)
MIRAVLFDLWGTLVLDPSSTSPGRLQDRVTKVEAALRAHGLDHLIDTAIEERLLRLSGALTTMHNEGLDASPRGRVHLYLENVTDLPPAALASLEAAITTIEPSYYPEPEPHARAVVAELKAMGLKTGLISNAGFTTAPTLRALLDYHGIGEHLDHMVFSDDHELAKPDPRIFQIAADAVGVQPSESVFVGDTPWNDIHGARQAGMVAVQIGPKRREGILPDLQIDTLAELIPGLRGLSLL